MDPEPKEPNLNATREQEKWKSDQDKKMKNYRILIVCQVKKKTSSSVLLMPDQNTRLNSSSSFSPCVDVHCTHSYRYNETNYFRSSVSQNTNRSDGFIEIFFGVFRFCHSFNQPL